MDPYLHVEALHWVRMIMSCVQPAQQPDPAMMVSVGHADVLRITWAVFSPAIVATEANIAVIKILTAKEIDRDREHEVANSRTAQ